MALEDVYKRNLEHKTHRAGWLRAAVLGINDGLVSTASLMIGVAAANFGGNDAKTILLTTGAAGIAAGAMSMAVGEYVSVRSQNDIEDSDRLLEIEHLAIDPEGELEELVEIYKERGLDDRLAREVAVVLTEKDALGTHLRDELGHHPHTKARPVQASIASAISFTLGGLIPFIAAYLAAGGQAGTPILLATLVGLIGAGLISARTSGSALLIPTLRVVIGGCLGMAITAGIGALFHTSV